MTTNLRQFIDDFKNEKHLWHASRESYEYSLASIAENYIDTYAESEEREYSELVQRATPTKPHVYTLFITDGPRNHMWNREISENRCGSCDKKIDRDFAFCPYCSQAIDWSEVK